MSLKIGPHATSAPQGTEDAGIVRTISSKKYTPLYSGPLAASAYANTPWVDTLLDGTTAVSVFVFSNTAFQSVRIVETDDIGVANVSALSMAQGTAMQTVSLSPSGALSANIPYVFTAVITARYWKVIVNAAGSALLNLQVGYTSSPNGQMVVGTLVPTIGAPPVLGVAPLSANVPVDASSPAYLAFTAQPGNAAGAAAVLNGATTTATPNFTALRTPAIFTGGQGAGGSAFIVANPQTTKKFRAMKYAIDIAEDATITSGPLPINIGFRFGLCNSLAATFVGSRSTTFDYTHRVVLPATVLATSFDGYVSPWIDLGNGVIPTVAGQPLYCGIQAVQPTSAVTPTWTLATTGQWEAGCAAFTTSGNRGAFKLRQYNVNTGVASAALTLAGARGTAVFVLVRTTNIAAGVPTVTVTDTAGNTWTALTAINNASDTGPTNGSSLQLIYCLNMVGTDANLGANIITATTSVHAATATNIIIAEYSNIAAADASAQTTGTGNSTAPAAGAFSPTSTGTLVLTYAATGTNQATCPTLTTAGFFAYAEQGGTAAPCLLLGDNWGNGTLAAGLVNVSVVGTEE